MKKYAIAMTAYRPTNTGFSVRLRLNFVRAYSIDEARGIALRLIQEEFPAQDWMYLTTQSDIPQEEQWGLEHPAVAN